MGNTNKAPNTDELATISGLDDSQFFTTEEIADKAMVRSVRRKVIQNMVKGDQVPEKTRDLEVLNQYLTSYDKEITDTAALRARVAGDNKVADAVSLVAEILMTDTTAPIDIEVIDAPMLEETYRKPIEDERILSIGNTDLEIDDYLTKDEE